MYINKEWTAYIETAIRNEKKMPRIHIAYGSPMWVAYKKAKRELYKKSIPGKIGKVRQVFRVLVKLCLREWFNIKL